jgi:hypothetical protein
MTTKVGLVREFLDEYDEDTARLREIYDYSRTAVWAWKNNASVPSLHVAMENLEKVIKAYEERIKERQA